MFSWLKKHFIPHEGNDHRPQILCEYNIRYIIIIILFLEIFTFLIPTLTRINSTGGMATVLPAILANLTNDERQAQNLKTLTVNPILNKAAEMKAIDMATHGYFAHTSPDGKTPWYWIKKVGYQYQYAGENLAINFSDSKDVTTAWMASPTHKANIVKGNYTEVGTGVASGVYEGKETVFVAQVYANPLSIVKSIKSDINKEMLSDIEDIKVVKTIEEEQPVNVLGAEIVVESENFVSLKETKLTQEPTFFQKLFSSPRNTTNIILYTIFGLISIALILYIFIKLRNHHKDLITNGLIVLAIIIAVIAINYYFSYSSMVVTQSIDYANQDE